MQKYFDMLINIVSRLLSALPMRWQLWCGDVIGLLWFDVFRIRRTVAMNNLKLCFPEMTEADRYIVARASVKNVGRTFIEFLRIPALASSLANRQKWKKQFAIEGIEYLELALKKNKGVCLLTAHIGNGDWGAVGMALNGVKLHIISKTFKSRWLNDFWFRTRSSLGTEFIPDRGSSLTILKLLKKNQIVVFMLDQFLGPPIGIKTKFFGHETGTPVGLALLGGRAEAAVVPVFTHRRSDGVTVVVFEPEIPFVEFDGKDESLTRMTQKYCDKIEEWVRLYPKQWMWIHRRWKKYKH